MSDKQSDKQEDYIEFEDDRDSYNDEDDIIGYHCLCCGNVQDSNDWGGECERCSAHALEEMYF
mgnify:CR=1 FL=1